MGWYFRERTTANPSPPWQHGRLVPGSGAAADIDVLWGDPGLASAPDAPNLMLMGSLVVPHVKFGPNTCTINGVPQTPCISDAVTRPARRRAWLAARRRVRRSLARRRQDVHHAALLPRRTPGSCNTADSNDSSLGHFYDGFDIAIAGGAAPAAAVDMRDADTSKEALWMMTTGSPTRRSRSSTPTPDRWARSVTIKQPITMHVRVRYDSGNRLWRMSPDSEREGGSSILKVNILGRNAPPKAVASDYKSSK